MIDLDQIQQKVKIKQEILTKVHMLFKKLTLNTFRSGKLPIKETQGKGLKY